MNEEIPAWRALLSGAAAGISVDVSLYPIDTLKTRLQSPHGFWKSGGFKGVYRGLSAAASGSAPGAALFFLTYESSKPFIHNHVLKSKEGLNANPLTHMLAASMAETTACLIRVPTEVIKQRMQTGGYDKLSFALSDTFRRYGIRGFYAGYGTTVAREIPFSFIQFPMWERFKLLWIKHINQGEDIKPYQGAFCGSISGAIAAAITTPLDVIKTRLMLRVDANNVPYNGFRDCVTRIHGEGGSGAFFKGVVPRVSWIFVGGFFFFGAYEKTKQMTSAW
eukprot:CAMPEP_0201566418 /NCGR_PEP_ID=MMETSP0190_2-20130828/6161_1 /ASSEMBLY_ACC=CAM_ASM_000263 /TAXON_ID=37353 /ORGANISM="Rosalina sp." /LENGTH=277 /DNA_ID=CAMNT_0047985083 /DNA_START=345 /DNA_END=1175 /DNA_ORIENTATION=+